MKPALLIIDMQNDGIKPESRLYTPGAKALVPVINKLANVARSAGVPVIWITQEHRRQLVDFGREADISPIHCVEGSAGADIIEGLERLDGDYTVIKRRYSGFYNTDLEVLLRCLGVDTVILTGIITDGCVLMTAMDAHARDFYLRVVADGCATTDDEAHRAALRIMARTQPNVVIDSEEAVQILVSSNQT
jgi:nicotinamidase-related amidase